jgi:hypothetical protein
MRMISHAVAFYYLIRPAAPDKDMAVRGETIRRREELQRQDDGVLLEDVNLASDVWSSGPLNKE